MRDKIVVLVVEDEALLREMIAEELRDAEFNVLEAENGAAALRCLEGAEPIDVLFTDIKLPGKPNGLELAAAARTRQPDIAVLYATGGTVGESSANERTAFLSKPYLPSAAVTMIHNLLAMPGA